MKLSREDKKHYHSAIYNFFFKSQLFNTVSLQEIYFIFIFYVHFLFSIFQSFFRNKFLSFPSLKEVFIDKVYHDFAQTIIKLNIIGSAGKYLTLRPRDDTSFHRVVNFGGYDYLGLSTLMNDHQHFKNSLSIYQGVSFDRPLQRRLEENISRWLGHEDCVIFNTGYGSNRFSLSHLLGTDPKTIIFSDADNHNSIIQGVRGRHSGIRKYMFPRNNTMVLASLLRKHTSGFKNIWVLCEGVYSMHGEILNLQHLIELKKQYGFYLFIDEAHSMGNIGPNGKGVCDLYGINHREVDIITGTFSKSFYSFGGFLSGRRDLIARIAPELQDSHTLLPAVTLHHIQNVLNYLQSPDGKERLRLLVRLSEYCHDILTEGGVLLENCRGSSTVTFIVGTLSNYIRRQFKILIKQGFVFTMVGYPVGRYPHSLKVRICINANHTFTDIREMTQAFLHLLKHNVPLYPERIKPVPQLSWKPENPCELSSLVGKTPQETIFRAFKHYGHGNSGPRLFFSDLRVINELEHVISRALGMETTFLMACSDNGIDCVLGTIYKQKKILDASGKFPKFGEFVNKNDLSADIAAFTSKTGKNVSEMVLLTEYQDLEKCNQFEDIDIALILPKNWIDFLPLPIQFPPNVKFVLSTLPTQGSFCSVNNNWYEKEHLNINAYVFSATLPIYMFGEAIHKLSEKNLITYNNKM